MPMRITLLMLALCLVVAVSGLTIGFFAQLPGDGNIIALMAGLGASITGQYPCSLLRHNRCL